jgi:hypothetical protein
MNAYNNQDEERAYHAGFKPEIINVPRMQYLMIDGEGAPKNNPKFQKAFQVLFGIAYAIKFLPKKGYKPAAFTDFKVAHPEGLWWMRNGGKFDENNPEEWRWTLMLHVPEFFNNSLLKKVTNELASNKNDDAYQLAYLAQLKEGECVQMMYIGPYEQEQASIAQMEALAHERGYELTGKHHEIYFGDPRRTRSEKFKTILRHPLMAA